MANELQFAVLIDSDNISEKYIKIILDEITNEGIATYKRIYGDWTSPMVGSWKNALLEYSIMPIQQYSYTTGKNATDSAMIIDAMDILYSGKVDGFCIVSSDSDFTRLAARLREAGKKVIGMGEKKTPKPFIAACNQFKYLDMLYCAPDEDNHNDKRNGTRKEELAPIIEAILTIIEENSDEDGWMFAGQLGTLLVKRFPDFDVRNYGFAKMTPFLHSLGLFEFKRVDGQLIYLRKTESKKR
ncbi:MAG: NYN domain-containing protein [Sphaerochaetaceae bacterium]